MEGESYVGCESRFRIHNKQDILQKKENKIIIMIRTF